MSNPNAGVRSGVGIVHLPTEPASIGFHERQLRDRGRTRTAILAAAMNLYKEEGYGAVTMRAVANQLGFTAPAIYNYFHNKEALFITLQKVGLRLMAKALIAPATADALDDLRAFFLRYYEFAKAEPAYFTLLYVDPSVPSVSRRFDDVRLLSAESGRHMTRCMAEGILPPGTRLEIAGAVLWEIVHGAAVLRQVQSVSPTTDFDSIAVAGLDVALAGIRAGFLPGTSRTR